MKGIKKAFGVLISSLVALSLTIGLIIVVTYSWFTNSQLVEPDLSGFSVSAYFGGGKGTEDDPFLIKNQRHLYNLAWLQYLGYFNKVGKLNSNGVIETTGHTSEMTQYSFSITQDLNMNGWDLPPIGTSLQPFVGLLNGNGYSIYNLHTTNQFTDFGKRHPSSVNSENFANVEMIGFMGVVGTISSMNNYGLSIDTAANAVANIKLKDNEVETRTSTSLVGIAVGYINGKVEDIGIVDSGLYIDSSTHVANIEDVSAYTVAGYATDEYVTKVSNTKASVLNPSGTDKTSYVFSSEGDTTGWGGSIDMTGLHARLAYYSDLICSTSINSLNHVTSERHVVTSSGVVTVYNQVTGTRRYTNNYTAGRYAGEYIPTTNNYANGIYLFDEYKKVDNGYGNGSGRGIGTQFNYLTGLYKTVRYIYINDELVDGYKITDNNGHYLNLNYGSNTDAQTYGTCTLGSGNNENTATVWIYKNNKLYTYSQYDGYVYWLNGNATELSVSYTNPAMSTNDPTNNSATSWTWSNTINSFVTTINNFQYGIVYENGWTLKAQNYHYITDNEGNYLSFNGTNLYNATSENDATLWFFSTVGNNPSGYISTTIGSTTYYLRYNNGLTFTNSTNNRTSWSNSGSGLYYNGYYIQFRDGNWVASSDTANHTGYYIKSADGYYLTFNQNRTKINNVTDPNEATIWTVNNGYYSVNINNTTYYLRYDLSLNTSQTRASWTNNNGILSCYYNDSRTYYLECNEGTFTTARNDNSEAVTCQFIQSSSYYKRSYVSNSISVDFDITTIDSSINKITWENKEESSRAWYIPLNTEFSNNNYIVKSNNTGYIIGGGHESTNNYKGDIRVSYYPITSTSSQKGIDGSYNKNTKQFTSIYTVNDSGNNINILNSTAYVKYADSKDNFLATLKLDSTNVYGLHFMDCEISMDHMITAPKVMINNHEHYNYSMPEDCIDFNLAENGFINFFAGYYFNNNNSFFSLNQIFRDDDNNITAIKHIDKIYKKNNDEKADYIYLYTDGTYTGSINGATKMFDRDWIENPGMSTNNYLYYFEIPANAGEYALGSVDGKVGAYLLYLDIGANAQKLNRTTITQKSTVVQSDFVYPNGISIITNDTTINPSSISLDASTSSVFKFGNVSGEKTIAVSRSAAGINYQTDLSDAVPIYVPRTVTVTKNSAAIQATAVRTTTSIYSQIQYIDHNVSTGDIFETNIQMITTDGVSAAPTYTIYKIGEDDTTSGFTRVLVDQTVAKPDWKLYAVVNGKNVSVDLTSATDTNANAIKSSLNSIKNSTGTVILEYNYDTFTAATNTYDIHIDMSLNNSELYYYVFSGNSITVTTTNTGGTVIYVTTRNTTYTFKMNDVVINAATINVPQTA